MRQNLENQNLVNNPWKDGEDKYDPSIPTATLQIYDYIAEELKRPKDTHVNRASSANMCYLRSWYQRNGFEGTQLTPRKIVNFALGDITERVVIYFIEQGLVGPGKLYREVFFGKEIGEIPIQGKKIKIHEQEMLRTMVGPFEITSHVDGWGIRNSDGKKELIEVKSAANFGFDEFKENGPGDYLRQAHVNMKAIGADSVRFYYLRKEIGSLWSRLEPWSDAIMQEVEDNYRLANQEIKPDRPDYPMTEEEVGQGRGRPKLKTGRMQLNWKCEYCIFTRNCFPDMVEEWVPGRSGLSKPAYFIPKPKEKENEIQK